MNNSTLPPNITDQNYTDYNYPEDAYLHVTVVAAICAILCLIGLVGNIIVFWYLCFKIKRNKYTVYIINLSVADFIYLLVSIIVLIINIYTSNSMNPLFEGKEAFYKVLEIFSKSAQYSGMFILTAISLERCLSVLFPFWYQCSRPQNLSSIVCASVWLIGCAESLIDNLVCAEQAFYTQTSECTAIQIIIFILAIIICLPVMVISSLILLIKVKRTFREQYSQKLYIIIIVAVFVFIISVIPINFVWFLLYFHLLQSDIEMVALYFASTYCLVLNCTIDPYIYFIVGKKWKQKTNHSIQDVLKQAFHEEEKNDLNSNRTSNTSSQTNLAF
ncbi:proto-oncogene Mas-like [Leptodactylus fuscus]|uniref:proto-oncogene Mas-like n=1 Tax=Leptodactylus fuscus TaxID=238119 RepID=UPI003F4E6222